MAERGISIGVDGRELLGRPTGVGQYLLAILERWTDASGWPHQLTIFVPETPPAELRGRLGSRVRWHVASGSRGTLWEQWTLPRALHSVKVDVFFAPGYTAPLLLPCPSVVAIYDVSYAAHPEWFGRSEGLRRRWISSRAAHAAHAVVTISAFSAGEISRYFGVPADRLVLAPPGAPPRAQSRSARRDPIVLYVGSLFTRRHIPLLIEGFARARRVVPNARLVIVGDNRTSPRIEPQQLADAQGVSDVVEWRAYVSNEEREQLYDDARVFAFLSDYEGFAMTPLEALAHGVPSVLLDTQVAREVYGTGAHLVGAEAEAVGRALVDLLSDDGAHAALVARAQPLLDKYAWSRSAQVIAEALEQAAGFVPEPESQADTPLTPAAVDVIIVSYNTAEDLLTCLRSLHASRPSRLGVVWVVDNASSDGSVERVRSEFPTVRCLALEENIGFGAANNRAIVESDAPLVLLLNSDTVVRPGAIDTLVERLEVTGAVAAGPRLVDATGRPEISFGPMLSPVAEWRQRQWVLRAASQADSDRAAVDAHLAAEREVDWVSGACLLVRRQAVIDAGLFDERYFMYEEDVDLCAALRMRGGRILFTPETTITHLRGRAVGRAGAPASAHYVHSHLAFYAKHLPTWLPLLKFWTGLRGRSVR